MLLALVDESSATSDQLMQAAGFLRDINRFDEAIEVCRVLVQRHPERGDIRFRLARLQQATGEFTSAIESLRQSVNRDPGLGGAWLTLAQAQRFEQASHPDLARMEQALEKHPDDEAGMCLQFAVGKARDDLAQYAEAWPHFARGNAAADAAMPWDRTGWDDWIHQCQGNSPAPPAQARRTDGVPVFIVGMLRSGTTFLEQRLDRHPQISGRGELNFLSHFARQAAPADTAGAELWKHLQQGDTSTHAFIDKNPLNFRFLGYLRTALPQARIIHVRRDGRDSCLSCFMQLFQHPDAAFANRLDSLETVYGDYLRLMALWEQRYPGWIHEITYEELVTRPREALAGCLQYIGVPWSDQVMETGVQSRAIRTASSWQARQEIYRRSLDRWKNYQAVAGEFLDRISTIDRSQHDRR